MEDIQDMELDYNPSDLRKVEMAGFMSLSHYEEFKNNCVAGLLEFGDLFLQRLGDTLEAALIDDALKIMRYWQQACDQAQLMIKIKLAKEKAENEKS